MDEPGAGRGNPHTGHCRADFASPCRAPLKKNDLQPHLIRYWLTSELDAQFAPKVQDICTLYQEAPALATTGERVVSTDELTGVQALERKHPGLPLAPGKVERREFEYIRHGTCAFIISRDVVTGQIVAPACGPTRTEGDFLAHLHGLVATDPTATRLTISTFTARRRWSVGSQQSRGWRLTSGRKAKTAFWPIANRGRLF
jgi:hypothetical protein